MANVEEIFRSCTAGGLSGELTAKNVSLYYGSPYSIWCEKFADSRAPGAPGTLPGASPRAGDRTRKRVLQTRYPGYAPIPYREPREGFLHLLEQMAVGAEVICGLPMF